MDEESATVWLRLNYVANSAVMQLISCVMKVIVPECAALGGLNGWRVEIAASDCWQGRLGAWFVPKIEAWGVDAG